MRKLLIAASGKASFGLLFVGFASFGLLFVGFASFALLFVTKIIPHNSPESLICLGTVIK